MALQLPRRKSTDGRDDISPGLLKRLKDTSVKLRSGKYEVSNLKMVDKPEPMAAYKDRDYRRNIAARYGIILVDNDLGYQTPIKAKSKVFVQDKSIYQTIKERYAA